MARSNAKGLKLSFKPLAKGSRQGRWFKIVEGQARYFGTGTAGDRDSYERALACYRQWLPEHRGGKRVAGRGLPPDGLAHFTGGEDDDSRRAIRMTGQAVNDAFRRPPAGADTPKPLAPANLNPKPQTVGDLIDLFLAEQKKRNERRHLIEKQRERGVAMEEQARANLSEYRYVSILTNAAALRAAVGSMPFDCTERAAADLFTPETPWMSREGDTDGADSSTVRPRPRPWPNSASRIDGASIRTICCNGPAARNRSWTLRGGFAPPRPG